MERYRIAGLTVDIKLKYCRTKKQAEPYHISSDGRKADMTLVLEQSVMEKAKLKYPSLSEDDLEYILLGIMFNDKLLDFDGIMLHSSAVGVGGYAYLFSADPGCGKSTHTSFYKEMLGERAVIINDDKPVIRLINGNYYVFGTPFSGKHDISINKAFLLGGICFLERSEKDFIEPLGEKDAIHGFLKQTLSLHGADRVAKKLEFLDKLIPAASIYRLGATNNISAAYVSFETMKKAVPVTLDETKDIITEQLSGGGYFKFRTKGNSMYPMLISGRDSVTLSKAESLKKGDIVLYKNNDGAYVLHRIIKINGDNVVTRGDSILIADAPAPVSNIIGKAVSFERKGKTYSTKNIFYKIYVFAYTSPPANVLRILKRKLKKK